jgi:hypothetical protein
MRCTSRPTRRSRTLFALVGLLLAAGCDSAAANGGLEVTAASGGSGGGGSYELGITWSKIGTPSDAAKIAACTELDGRVYALKQDRTIWVSHANGSDGSWTFVVDDKYVDQIFCAGERLYVLNDDRSLWRNAGSDSAVNFVYVGKPGYTRRITGTSVLWPLSNLPAIYALNGDYSLWWSIGGAEGSWKKVDQHAADAIATGPGGGAHLFALRGSALQSYEARGGIFGWYSITDVRTFGDTPPLDLNGAALAASDELSIYALLADHTLWKGVIRNLDQ